MCIRDRFVGAGQDGQAVHDAVGRRQTAALKAQAGQQDVGLILLLN